MKIFLICSVCNATEEQIEFQKAHVKELEAAGNKVHYPPRDTKQDASGIDICEQNMRAISDSDIVHLIYDEKSQGIHFDMGVAFAFGKPINVIHPGKSYYRMALEWMCRGGIEQ